MEEQIVVDKKRRYRTLTKRWSRDGIAVWGCSSIAHSWPVAMHRQGGIAHLMRSSVPIPSLVLAMPPICARSPQSSPVDRAKFEVASIKLNIR